MEPERLRFFTDENVDPAIAQGARRRGVDAIAATECARLGFSDAEQIEWAARERRVIVTHDEGFWRWSGDYPWHAGILFVESGLSIGGIVRWLELMAAVYETEEMIGRIEKVRRL